MSYRIVCTIQEPRQANHDHARIIEVGTGSDPDKTPQRWALGEVLEAIAKNDVFYTRDREGNTAKVIPILCNTCNRWWIKSTPDATTNNNLDNLRSCNWK